MNDKELSVLGEKLYSAVIGARLSPPALADLAAAIETRRPWQELGERTKISAFLVAAKLSGCAEEAIDSRPPTRPGLAPAHIDEDGAADLALEDLTPTPPGTPGGPARESDRPPFDDGPEATETTAPGVAKIADERGT